MVDGLGERPLHLVHPNLQGPILLSFGPATVSLNSLHLPTGYVTLEDVIRFCIHDLGMPPLSADWDETLIQSDRELGEQLTGDRQVAAPGIDPNPRA
jgi:hypothetical protein